MSLFIKKIILLGLIVFTILLGLFTIPQWKHNFRPGETESNLLVMDSDTHYDFIMLGTSHGREFSRHNNHTRVENILGKTFANLSLGHGHGIYGARIFLDYFLKKGNVADTIVYLIDPWIFYSAKWNEDSDLFNEEPIDLDFLSFIIKRRVNALTVINYFKSNISWERLTKSPAPDTEKITHLDSIDSDAVTKRIASLYPDGLKRATFEKYRGELSALLNTATTHNIRIVFIIPPTLLGDLPSEDVLKQTLDELKVTWHDFSNSVIDPHLYFDHDHLNTKGIVTFTEDYLRPIISKTSR